MAIIFFIAALSLVASAMGTLSGFGLGTIMMPLLVLQLPFAQAIMLVAIVHWFHNIWRIALFWRGITRLSWMLFLYFGIPSIVASFLGALLIVRQASSALAQTLGLFLIAYAFFLFLRPTFKIKETKTTAIIGGTASGFLAGFLGIRGAVKGAFMAAFNLEKTTYIATMAMVSVMVDSTRLCTYYYEGVRLSPDLQNGLFIFIPASLLGSMLAHPLVHRIPQERFRPVIAFFLLGIGVWLVLWSIR